MSVDKNLFMYDLAVVAIIKNEAPYLQEWLDYHLLAGVNHFFIYDNQDDDEQKKILQPYIDAGIVTHIFYPGKGRQYEAYTDAVKKYKFFCRYMAFIDGDEFIFPKSKPTIAEVVDEILYDNKSASGLAVNWQIFGSNYQEKADYSRGVLERFTRRAPKDWYDSPDPPNLPYDRGNSYVKTILNPRMADYFDGPHIAKYFIGKHAINENRNKVSFGISLPISVEKITINHYTVKSKEEFLTKIQRGAPDKALNNNIYNMSIFNDNDRNEEYDDEILKYRDTRKEVLDSIGGGGEFLEKISAANKIDFNKKFNALLQNLSPTFAKDSAIVNFAGNLETFLTCRAISTELKENFFDKASANFFEEKSLQAIQKTLSSSVLISDVELLFSELPNILKLKYSVVEEILQSCIKIIPQVMNVFRTNNLWKNFVDLQYLLEMLKVFDDVKK